MKIKFNPNIFKITTVILLLVTIVLTALCIRLNFLNDDLEKDADYTYDLYIEGITVEERKMYQEWIDKLDTDAYSAYNRGYKDGIKEGEENAADENYSDAYDEGYHQAQNEHSEILDNIATFAILALIVFMFVINHKLNNALKLQQKEH